MAAASFQTNPYYLAKLLDDCHTGVLQLPDFQRSWVWDEDRIIEQAAGTTVCHGNAAQEGVDRESEEAQIEAEHTLT